MTSSSKQLNDSTVTPRQVADKSTKGNLNKAIRMALDVESQAVRLNTQSFNNNRYRATSEINDYQQLKEQARKIKESSIKNIDELLDKLEKAITARGGHFYLAKDGSDASEYITKICQKHEAKLVIKAKSITSEEIKLNDFLETEGIEVAETDLAEFILQVSDEQPSHIVAPAIHRSRERISELFKESFETDLPLDSGEELTKFARDILRKKFLTADVGISGANVIAAESGTILLVESEGNIRMVTQAPPVHIALAGLEKVVPTVQDLVPFIELLAPSATGQALTSYTSIINPPLDVPSFSFDGRSKKVREFHLVLIDNGRMEMRNDPVFQEALYCIRCSACLNSCANFQALGGHAFGGETYSGGIGGSWEAGTGELLNANFSELCTGCSRCLNQCPVQIDIPWLNENLRFRLNEDKPSLQKQFFANFNTVAKWGGRLSPVSNLIANLKPIRSLTEKILGVDQRRELTPFTRKTFKKSFKRWQKRNKAGTESSNDVKVLLFADVYTNYSRPKAGMAAVRILHALGLHITLSDVFAEGRASLSQGKLMTAGRRAKKTVTYLEKYLTAGCEVVAIEPSVLALFKQDYSHFLDDTKSFSQLQSKSFEIIEFLNKTMHEKKLNLKDYFDIERLKKHPKVFFHSHCQQRTTNTAQPTLDLLQELGFDVVTSNVECCGMAGSFGYKKDYYDVSMRVGENLAEQINAAKTDCEDLVVVASGTSCFEQIKHLTSMDVMHPAELIAKFLK